MKVYPLFFQAGKILALRAKNELSSVLVGREVYPLFQAGKSLSSKVFYFRDESILCSCRQGS